MLLSWINTSVTTVKDALWYIGLSSAPGSDASQKPPPQAAADSTGTNVSFFALVIGINAYTSISKLRGCVADADDMVDYLTKTLRVPPSNITNLRNKEATRSAIRNSIAALASDDRIKRGDPIVIFYAGHGTTTKAPFGWSTGDGKIQMLCPVNFHSETNQTEDWQGLPDIVFADLLTNLAKAKGDNITVILDSCHSGSATRDGDERGIKLEEDYVVLPSIFSDIDKERDRDVVAASGFLKTSMSSHVLLAACSESMTARESNMVIGGRQQRRGNFTRALLSLLRDPSLQGASLTYTELIKRLPDIGSQYPQCDGEHRNRILFDEKVPIGSKVLYQITVGARSVIKLSGGEVHGITEDAIVSVFASPDALVSLGRLQVLKVRACSSTLQRIQDDTPFDIPASACAVVIKVGKGRDISVAIPVEDSFLDLFRRIVKDMEEQRPDKRNIQVVERTEPHELALSADGDKAIFNLTDPGCVNAGLSRLPSSVDLKDTDNLATVLGSSANFFYHLRRTNNSAETSLAPLLTLEAYKIKSGFLPAVPGEKSGVRVNMRDGGDLLEGASTLDVETSYPEDGDQTPYGFRLENNSEYNLYVWAFLFQMSTLSISCLYKPPSAKALAPVVRPPSPNTPALTPNKHAGKVVPADASLLAYESLSIGYGAGGVSPLVFTQGNCAVDVIYLKLFITTQYVDLSFIEQFSPLPIARDVQQWRPDEMWDTKTLMLVQKPAP